MYATCFANAVGYCWIPNVAGNITTSEHIEQEADHISRETNLMIYHEMMEDGVCILFKDRSESDVEIYPVDSHGLCVICSSKPGKSLIQTNGDRDFISRVNQTWSELVTCLNNDPTANRCTAMDRPLPLPVEPDIKKDIAKRFLEVMSKTADLALRYESHSYSEISKHLQIDITLDSNSIYLEIPRLVLERPNGVQI